MTVTATPGLSSQRAADRQAARQASAGAPAAPPPVAVTAADKQAHLQRIAADARKRTFLAFTIGKNLLPQADAAVVARFASALVEAPTPLLSAALRRVASLAATSKMAELLEDMSGTSLNKFVEDPSLLEKLKGEVTSELKGDPKTASIKTAAPGEEPKDDNLPPTGDLPGDAATAPPAEMPSSEPAPAAPAEQGDLSDTGEPSPANSVAPESGVNQGLLDQIDTVEGDVEKLEGQVDEVRDESLSLAKIFGDGAQDEKITGLANEDEPMDEMEGLDFFGPSGKDEMEGSMDFGAPETGNPQDFFAGNHTTASLQVDAFLAGRTASEVDVPEGDMASEFATDLPGDNRDVDTDHMGDMLSEVLDGLHIETMNQKRDTAPNMKTPEAVQASQKNGGRTAADARATITAGPKAPARAQAAPRRSSVNPGQPGLPRTASALDTSSAEIDSLLFRDRI